MTIYEHSDYRSFLRGWMKASVNGGRGLLRAWASELGVHSTLLSQIMNSKKEMSLEMADKLARHLGLSASETDFFLLLVMHARAGTASLASRLEDRIREEQKKAKNVSSRLKVNYEMNDATRGVFYSSWIYAGVRNLAALERQSTDSIAAHLGLPRDTVQSVVEFLLEANLCTRQKGAIVVGPKRTHVGAESSHVQKHHQNWRLRGFEKMVLRRPDDLFFTFPCSLSSADAEKLRQLIPLWIEQVHKLVEPSPSEVVRCLNIDFYEY